MRPSLLLVAVSLAALPAVAQPATPRQLFPGLFEAVQLGRIFPDNKTFVDAVPLQPPTQILSAWQQQKQQPGFDLNRFVQTHFQLPDETATVYHTDIAKGIRHHIDTLWTVLQRPAIKSVAPYSSLLPLPKPYLVPGGRFREIYYWDSYFTMVGLREAHRTTLLRNMTDNFAYLIETYGFIPNGNRTYYLTRSQPPFFSRMVELLAEEQGDTVLIRYQPQLLREYAYWMAGSDSLAIGKSTRRVVRLADGHLLNRYWDSSTEPREESYAEDVAAAKGTLRPAADVYRDMRAAAASGWDFSTRWFGPEATLVSIRTTSLIPVDLNCLMLALEQTIARSYTIGKKPDTANIWVHRAVKRQQAIQKYCWNENAGWFTDYDWQQKHLASVRTLAGIFPLAFGVATDAQSKIVAQNTQNSFLKSAGLLTTLSNSGQQWDSPNAWAPLQYLAVQGLRRYHHTTLADTIRHRWIKLNTQVFHRTGKLLEKYNVTDTTIPAGGGEYPLQDGFGWTNGVLLQLMNQAK